MVFRVILLLGLLVGCSYAQTTITLRPTADGSVKQWNNNAGAACSGTACFSQVNETTGATNCTGSALVKGDGVLNKSPATTGSVEQYTMTVTSIPNNSVIQSITVHACEARGGGTNTSSTLRIVLNGATTTCGSSQSVVAAFAELTCTFASLNVTKAGGTTLEIGNATTQTRAINVDAIEAEVTYIAQQTGAVTAAFATAPAITKLRNVPKATAGAFNTSPAVARSCSGNCGAPVNRNGAAAATAKLDPPCCAISDSPLSVGVHFGTGATTANVITRTAAISTHLSPSLTILRNVPTSIAGAVKIDSPCCALVDFPLAVGFHTSPIVNILRQSSGNASIGTGLSISSGLSATARIAVGKLAFSGFAVNPPCCASLTSPFSVTAHFSPIAVGVKHSGQIVGDPASVNFSSTCQSCVGHFFNSASIKFLNVVNAFISHTGTATTPLHFSPVVSTRQGFNKTVAQGLSTSAVASDLASHFSSVISIVHFGLNDSASGPGSHSVVANSLFNTNTSADETAATTSDSIQFAHAGVAVTISVGLTKQVAHSIHVASIVTAFVRTPADSRFVIVVD